MHTQLEQAIVKGILRGFGIEPRSVKELLQEGASVRDVATRTATPFSAVSREKTALVQATVSKAAQIRKMLKDGNRTHQAIADKVGVTRGYVTNIANGR